MKRLEKLLVNVVAILLIVVSCFGLSACKEDIRTLELTISVYNYETDETETATLTVDLYAHLAPKTVSQIEKYAKDGYYNNTVFYKITTEGKNYPNQIMLGDLKQNDLGDIVLNDIKPEIKGEFERGGTSGSNLTVKRGSIGLWRSWYEYDGSYNVSSTAMNSGRATWFIPTSTSNTALTSYNQWFCVFAQFDLSGENLGALELITDAINEYTVDYVICYTGEYDADNKDEGYGLTAHCIPADDFDQATFEAENGKIFEAEGEQLVCYNKSTVSIPAIEDAGEITAKVTSVKIK